MSKRTARRPRPAPAVVRAMGPADLLRHVQDLTGVDPEDSLVLVLFRRSGGTRSRTHGAIRVDLQHGEDAAGLERWATAVLGTVLEVEGVTGVAVAVYTPETFAPGGRPPAAAQVRAVARQAGRMGLEVLGRFCVAADGWGSLDDPDLPRGGRPLAEIRPSGSAPRRPRGVVDVPLAPEAAVLRFAAGYVDWWTRAEGPGGTLHGVRLTEPGTAFGPAAEPDPAMERYRWGRDTAEVVDLVEAMLAPHDPAEAPCACRPLLLALAERQGLDQLVLLQLAWGRPLAMEVWTAVNAPAGRERSLDRLAQAITGGRFRRPDPARIDLAVAVLLETAAYVPPGSPRVPIDGMLAWLHWASGGSSAAAAYAERALRLAPGRDIPSLVLGKVQRGELPLWAFRRDPAKPDRFAALLEPPTPAG